MDPLSWILPLPTWLLLLILTFIASYVYFTWNFGFLEKQGVKVQRPWPFLGNLDPFFRKSMKDYDQKNYQLFGRIYGLYEGRNPGLHVGEPELIKLITVKDFAVFPHSRTFELPKKDKMFNHFLTNLRGEEWKRVRNIMTPSFTTGKLKGMTYLIEECCDKLAAAFNKYAETGESFNVKRMIGSLTMDVIANCAFGTQINSIENPDNDFVKNANKVFNPNKVPWQFLVLLIFPKFARYLPAVFPEEVSIFFTNTLNKVMEMRKTNKQPRKDFLELLLESKTEENEDVTSGSTNETQATSKKVMTTDLILSQSVLFLLAGHETTATLLSFALYELALNQDIQDKLAAEVKEAFEHNEDKVSYEMISRLTYVDMILSESLRKYPPIVRTERECTEEGYILNGIQLKKGMTIGIPVYSIHHDPEFYPDPEVFDPERFSVENKAKRNPFTYLPFGAGPRNCVGMRFAFIEAKMALAILIRQLRFTKCAQTEIPVVFGGQSTSLLSPISLTLTVERRTDK